MTISARDLIYKYTQGKLSGRPEFYAGRGNNRGDLNSAHLEMVHTGIKTEIGADAAREYVNMVAAMTADASATTFLVSLYRLESNGWKRTPVPADQGESMAEALSDALRGDRQTAEAATMATMAGMMGMMFGGTARAARPGEGYAITGEFLHRHRKELDGGKLPPKNTAYTYYYPR